MEPCLGCKHIRVVAIDGYPKLSYPGILSEIDSLAMEYRWNTRAIFLDPEEARGILDKTRKKWRSRIRGFKDQVLRSQNGAINLYAQIMAEDAEQAMGLAASGDVQFVQYTSSIVCMDENLQFLSDKVSGVVKRLQKLGFSSRIETVNALEAWARNPSRRWIPKCAAGDSSHIEFGRHASHQLGMAGRAGESIAINAEE